MQGVEVHVQAGGGDMNDHTNLSDKSVGPSATTTTHDIGVGMDAEDVRLLGKPPAADGEGGGVGVSMSGGGSKRPNKRKRNSKPFRIHLEPLSSIVGDEAGDGEGSSAAVGNNGVGAAGAAALAEGPGSALVMASLGERIPVDKPNGRYNKNGVCFHKASNKWRAIVYVNKKQVNLGYYATKEESELQVNKAREHGLPKNFTNIRALQQPKRSGYPGVNWDKHCKRWLARVYEPSVNGMKGKEHKVGYFDDENVAAAAVKAHRLSLGLPAGMI